MSDSIRVYDVPDEEPNTFREHCLSLGAPSAPLGWAANKEDAKAVLLASQSASLVKDRSFEMRLGWGDFEVPVTGNWGADMDGIEFWYPYAEEGLNYGGR